MKNAKTLPADQRDKQLEDFIANAISRADMARRSGLPIVACLIGRSVVPMLVAQIYCSAVDRDRGVRLAEMLARLADHGVITDSQLMMMRESLVAITDYGSGRDATAIVQVMKQLRMIAMEVGEAKAEKVGGSIDLPTSNQTTSRRPGLFARWQTSS